MLHELLDIKIGDVISVVGSGGKTSLIMYLSKIINDKKVCITTTTKMYYPERNQYDYIATNLQEALKICEMNKVGKYFFGSYSKELNKICSLEIEELNKMIDNFQLTLIESDGAKRKLIKGWAENEPIISSKTTKTIGIINLDILGKVAKEENVHRISEFIKIADVEKNELITKNTLIRIILHKKGLFKNAKGERILLVNGIEGQKREKVALELLEELNKQKENYIQTYIYGSIKENRFYLYNTEKNGVRENN